MRKLLLSFLFLAVISHVFCQKLLVEGKQTVQEMAFLGPVMTCKTIYTTFKDNPDDAAGISQMELTFDRDGYLLLRYIRGQMKLSYTYDKEHRIVNEVKYNEKYFDKNEYKYSYLDDESIGMKLFQNGVLIEDEVTDKDGYIISLTKYSDKGEIKQSIEKTVIDGKTEIISRRYSNKLKTEETKAVYDSDGNILSQTRKRTRDLKPEWNWEYEYSGGKLSQVTYVYNPSWGDKRTSEWQYEYKNGLPARVTRFADGIMSETRQYSYKDGMRDTETIEYYDSEENPQVFARRVLSYDTAGNVRLLKLENLKNTFSFSESRDYHGDLLSAVEKKNANGYIFYSENRKYDSDDRITAETRQGVTASFMYSDYNDNGQLLSRKILNADGIYLSGEENKYDSFGNLLLKQVFGQGKQLLNSQRYEYKYDEYNNWIKMTEYHSDNLKESYNKKKKETDREIIYYDPDEVMMADSGN